MSAHGFHAISDYGYSLPRFDNYISGKADLSCTQQRYFVGSDYEDQVYPASPINVFASIR